MLQWKLEGWVNYQNTACPWKLELIYIAEKGTAFITYTSHNWEKSQSLGQLEFSSSYTHYSDFIRCGSFDQNNTIPSKKIQTSEMMKKYFLNFCIYFCLVQKGMSSRKHATDMNTVSIPCSKDSCWNQKSVIQEAFLKPSVAFLLFYFKSFL